jgi:membrane associated rhomboid family serine protease
MRIFGREPALWLGMIAALLNVIVGFGWHLTDTQVSLINIALAAVFAVAGAVLVRPFPVPILIGAVNAVLSVAIAFGVHLSSASMGLIDAGIFAVMAFVLRQSVTPTPSAALRR